MERGRSLWNAAQILRYEGMELIGTELEPDWFDLEGQYDPSHPSEQRKKAKQMRLAAPSEDELMRLQQNSVTHPSKRFHYRYLATKLAWEAAKYMPDNSDETAEILCIAGNWMKYRDPKTVDQFYKALKSRCPSTALGKKAADIHWMPNPPKKESDT